MRPERCGKRGPTSGACVLLKEIYDVVIAGGGPAGASCGTFCAKSGLRTLILEKSRFPREKVCGDCINPACWPVLDRLGVSESVLRAPHVELKGVRFIAADGRATRVPFRTRCHGEIAIRRSILDAILLDRAREAGAEVLECTPVKAIRSASPWKIETNPGRFLAKYLIAADGRNSPVARMLGLMPLASKNRVGLQTHAARAGEFDASVSLRLLPFGYCGISSIDEKMRNVCLVSRPRDIDSFKQWAKNEFDIPDSQKWRTIAPLSRRRIHPVSGNLLLTGDAARVVEPFTGEGIYYAVASGELAAHAIIGGDPGLYARAHSALYRGRLWVNRLARWVVTHPRAGNLLLTSLLNLPSAMDLLTRRIVRPASRV